MDGYEQDCMRRFFKLACAALHREFGFGAGRLQRFIAAAGEHAGEQDEIFWYHVDRLLVEQLGIPFDREKEG